MLFGVYICYAINPGYKRFGLSWKIDLEAIFCANVFIVIFADIMMSRIRCCRSKNLKTAG